MQGYSLYLIGKKRLRYVLNLGAIVHRWLAVASGDLQMAEAEMPLLYIRVTSRCQEEPRKCRMMTTTPIAMGPKERSGIGSARGPGRAGL